VSPAKASTRRVLVTGATGFIGRHSLAPLQRRGFEVHALARSIPADAAPGVLWHTGDLLTGGARSLLEAVRPTHLLHFAWYAEHGKFWTSAHNLEWLSATLSLLRDFAAAGGTRFVGAGTCAEYDWSGNLYDETVTPLRPATLYGAAKASAFLTGEAFAKTAGIEFAWGRVFHLFGPGEAANRLVPALIRAHLRGESLDCGPENHQRDFLSAASVADAFAALCDREITGAVNIGSGKPRTFRELSDTIARLAGSRGDIRFGAIRDPGPETLVPNVDRLLGETRGEAHGEARWTPPASLEESLSESIAWWRNHL